MMRNQPWEKRFAGALAELYMPFVQPDIAASAIYEVVTNRRLRSGAPIYNEDAPATKQAGDIAEHLIVQMGPGQLNPTLKVIKALRGQKDSTGRVYDLANEVWGTFGLRMKAFDPKYSLYFRVGDFREGLGNANSYLRNIAGDIDPVDDAALREAFDQANEMRLETYNDMMQFVNAAKKSGVSASSIRKVLRVSGISSQYASALSKGKPAPKWRIGKTFLKGAIKRARLLIDRETAREMKRRKQFVRSAARALQ
jgi:hypothetical protein